MRQWSQLMAAAWEHRVDTGTNDYADPVRQWVHRGPLRHVNEHQSTVVVARVGLVGTRGRTSYYFLDLRRKPC